MFVCYAMLYHKTNSSDVDRMMSTIATAKQEWFRRRHNEQPVIDDNEKWEIGLITGVLFALENNQNVLDSQCKAFQKH